MNKSLITLLKAIYLMIAILGGAFLVDNNHEWTFERVFFLVLLVGCSIVHTYIAVEAKE